MNSSAQQAASEMAVRPPGIEWEKIGGKSWRVTIRRQPEVEVRPMDYVAMRWTPAAQDWAVLRGAVGSHGT